MDNPRKCQAYGCDMLKCPHWGWGCCDCGADFSPAEMNGGPDTPYTSPLAELKVELEAMQTALQRIMARVDELQQQPAEKPLRTGST